MFLMIDSFCSNNVVLMYKMRLKRIEINLWWFSTFEKWLFINFATLRVRRGLQNMAVWQGYGVTYCDVRSRIWKQLDSHFLKQYNKVYFSKNIYTTYSASIRHIFFFCFELQQPHCITAYSLTLTKLYYLRSMC